MNTPLILHLMRHGAPEMPGLMLGHSDALASAAGVGACVRNVEGLAFDAVITSDLIRAVGCAEAIAKDAGVAVRGDPRWRELDFGAWDGLATDAIDAPALAAFWDDPDASPPPGGERWQELCARVADALAAIAVPTLVVTHAGAIRAALSVLCGFDYRQGWAIDLPYAGVMTLRIWREPTPAAQITALRP